MMESKSGVANVVVSCFFGGSSSSFANRTSLVEMFGRWCQDGAGSDSEDDISTKLLFDGVGVAYGTMGMLFGRGLDEQAAQVVARVKRLRETFGEIDVPVCVNAVGLSRGGVACLVLAKLLQEEFGSKVRLNLLLIDPVPGNSITAVKFDRFVGASWTRQCIDLTNVTCISRVLSIYPHEPLPDVAFHAPLIPSFHPSVKVEEDVVLGCHLGAIASFKLGMLPNRLCFLMMKEFLTECGTVFADKCPSSDAQYCTTELVVADLDEYVCSKHPSTVRSCHSLNKSTKIVCSGETRRFLNRWHRRTVLGPEEKELSSNDTTDLLLYIAR